MAEPQGKEEDAGLKVAQFLGNLFNYHSPFGDQTSRYERLRGAAKLFALNILSLTPAESREQALALDSLRQAVMWANAAIACNEVDPGSVPADPSAPAPVSAAQVDSPATTRPQAENATVPVAPDAGKQEKPDADPTILPPAAPAASDEPAA